MKTLACRLHACRHKLLLLVLGCGLGFSSLAAETVKVGGTGAALGTMRQLAAEFAKNRPEVKIEILPYIGSTGAIKGVNTGAINIGLSGRPAKPEEQKPNLRFVRYAITPLVLATHPGVKVAGLKRAQLVDIYAANQTRWDDGGPIRIILRPPKETDNDALRSFSQDMSKAVDTALARKGLHTAATDQEAADAIEATPGSIGTTTLSLVVSEKRKVKVLSLDGVMPSTQSLANGSYPDHKPLYFVLPNPVSPTVKAFVDFVGSPKGHTILIDNAQLPVKDSGA